MVGQITAACRAARAPRAVAECGGSVSLACLARSGWVDVARAERARQSPYASSRSFAFYGSRVSAGATAALCHEAVLVLLPSAAGVLRARHLSRRPMSSVLEAERQLFDARRRRSIHERGSGLAAHTVSAALVAGARIPTPTAIHGILGQIGAAARAARSSPGARRSACASALA
jgi:hypothetical protein